jgi:glycosyltransferase involved in cell wall biosynthesis
MVSVRYPPLLGGVETHVHEVARRMGANGLDVTVLTTDPGGDLRSREHQGPVEVRRYPTWPTSGDLFVAPALLRQLVSGGYDIVHVQGIHTLVPPMALAAVRRAGIPTVVTFHTGGHSSRVRNLLRATQWRALRPALRRADALVAVCDYEVERFSRLLGVERSRIHRIANGADRLPVAQDAPTPQGAPLVVSVGRLERYKGHHRLIAAMPALRASAPRAHLVVVGRGPYETELRRQAARLGVEKAVTFTAFGHDRRDHLGALVHASDVMALLSDYEAHPVAVMEALALGTKVVVADGSGLAELARHPLVTVIDPRAPAATVAQVLADAASGTAVPAPTLPTWDDCADGVERLYDEVLRARRRQPQETPGAP